MSDLNTCTFVGRLGADPELKVTPDGNIVVTFRMAVNNYVKGAKDRNGKVTNQEPMWLRCEIWGQRAEFVEKYALKGMQVTVSGSLRNRSYTDRDGNERTSLELRLTDINVPFQGDDERLSDRQTEAAYSRPSSSSGKTDEFLPDFPDDTPEAAAVENRSAGRVPGRAPVARTRK